jgi:signal transduction histidine kinase
MSVQTPDVSNQAAKESMRRQPTMLESLLDDPKTLFNMVVGLIFFYIISIYLAVHGSIYCVFFFAMSISYTALLIGAVADAVRLSMSAFIAIGAAMIVWSLVATAFHQYHYALAVAAYGLWALAITANVVYGSSGRSQMLMIIAHSLALLGFSLVGFSWVVDVPAAGASIAAVLAGCMSILYDCRSPKEAEQQPDTDGHGGPASGSEAKEHQPDPRSHDGPVGGSEAQELAKALQAEFGPTPRGWRIFDVVFYLLAVAAAIYFVIMLVNGGH